MKFRVKDSSYDESFGKVDMTIEYGLESSIRQDEPYFVIGCSMKDSKGNNILELDEFEMILKTRPDMKDLIDMYNSDINGEPLYALHNGWHFISSETMREPYAGQDRADILSGYLRIPHETAELLVEGYREGNLDKERFAKFVDNQKPRWKQEANAIIEKYHLLEREQTKSNGLRPPERENTSRDTGR